MSSTFSQIASVSLALLALIQLAVSADASNSTQAKSKQSSHRYSHRSSFLVPPPPPTAVSPTVLAAYPTNMHGGSFKMGPPKPRHLAEQMKLTAVMDDVAFFKVSGEESIHLQKGGCFQTVTVANVSPNEVILEEKGLQFVKHLR
jgi:hypothetical protein